MDKLFIPSKIRVGYVKRNDTYTNRLAYVIYYDSKGKLRKETSFEQWRDKKIQVDEFENKPHSGFVINKGVKRYGHWGSGRSMIRIYDDRGIEFEITINNLTFILMTTDCLKRGLEGDFVYAWYGKELVLLPTGCEEYKESQDFTSLQSKKIGVKDMIPGCSYKNKQAEDVVYIGRFDCYEMDYDKGDGHSYRRDQIEYVRPKRHIFYQENKYGSNFSHLSGLSSIASINSDVPVSNYAELLDEFNKKNEASRTVGLEEKPYKFETDGNETKDHHGSSWLKSGVPFLKNEDGSYMQCDVRCQREYNANSKEYTFKGYTITGYYSYSFKDGVFGFHYNHTLYGRATITNMWRDPKQQVFTYEEMAALPFVKLVQVKSNGKKITIK